MPETTETLIEKPVETEGAQTQQEPAGPAPEQELDDEALNSMTREELQTYASTGETPKRARDDKGRFVKAEASAGSPGGAAPAAAKAEGGPAPAAPAGTQMQQQPDGSWIEIEVDEGSKLRFKNEDEFRKSFVHAQRLIRSQKASLDKYNAERGQFGQAQQTLEQSQAKINELTAHIAALQQNAAQMTQGRPVSQNPALAALQRQQGPVGLEAIYQDITALRNDLLAEKATNEKIRTEFTETITGLRQKDAEAAVSRGVEDLYREVKDLQKGHPEFATAEDFSKIDDIVSTYGEEAAQAMVSPSDFAQYQKVMEVVGLYKNGPEGEFDLKRANFKNLEEALLIHSHRSGTLGQAMVQAHKAGVQQFENALNRNAQSATTLPNSVSGASQVQMGENEIDEILSMDPEKIKASPELTARFNKAMEALNINQKL